MSKTLGIHEGFVDADEYYVRQYRDGRFFRRIKVKLWGFSDSPISSNGTHGRIAVSDPSYTSWGASPYTGDDPRDFHVGDILYGDNISVDIEERHITVIKPKPLLALTTKIKHKNKIILIPEFISFEMESFLRLPRSQALCLTLNTQRT